MRTAPVLQWTTFVLVMLLVVVMGNHRGSLVHANNTQPQGLGDYCIKDTAANFYLKRQSDGTMRGATRCTAANAFRLNPSSTTRQCLQLANTSYFVEANGFTSSSVRFVTASCANGADDSTSWSIVNDCIVASHAASGYKYLKAGSNELYQAYRSTSCSPMMFVPYPVPPTVTPAPTPVPSAVPPTPHPTAAPPTTAAPPFTAPPNAPGSDNYCIRVKASGQFLADVDNKVKTLATCTMTNVFRINPSSTAPQCLRLVNTARYIVAPGSSSSTVDFSSFQDCNLTTGSGQAWTISNNCIMATNADTAHRYLRPGSSARYYAYRAGTCGDVLEILSYPLAPTTASPSTMTPLTTTTTTASPPTTTTSPATSAPPKAGSTPATSSPSTGGASGAPSTPNPAGNAGSFTFDGHTTTESKSSIIYVIIGVVVALVVLAAIAMVVYNMTKSPRREAADEPKNVYFASQGDQVLQMQHATGDHDL